MSHRESQEMSPLPQDSAANTFTQGQFQLSNKLQSSSSSLDSEVFVISIATSIRLLIVTRKALLLLPLLTCKIIINLETKSTWLCFMKSPDGK